MVVVGTVFRPSEIPIFFSEIAAKVTFTGQILKSQLIKWYQIADVGVLPSYSEQCSYTGMEMMMCGLPIVASDGFCVRDMFQNNNNAIIAKIGNIDNPEEFEENLTQAIINLLTNRELANSTSRQARAQYEANYKIDDMQLKYEQLFELI